MEEIKIGLSPSEGSGLDLLQQMTERSKENGVQIGVPWTKFVYNYLFEQSSQQDLDGIMEALGAFVTEDAVDDSFF